MGERVATEYVQLSNRIFVPKEWPVRGIETFLLKLGDYVINDVTSDKLIILQVRGIPTMLIHRQENYETRYFFEKIFDPKLIDAYVIDVVFKKNDNYFVSKTNSMESEDSSSESSPDDAYNPHEELSLDDYVISTHQSQNRTTYYFEPVEKSVPTLTSERKTNCGTQQYSARRAKRQAMSYDILLLFAATGIAALIYITVLSKIKFD